tara:strand:+ start:2078 stop:3139 length:1062 start_codon:yes stop_codon:yes gene_type:complete
MGKIAFITGITGQDGSYLAELLLDKKYIVYGLIRRSSNINTQRINHLYKYDSSTMRLRYGDITDKSSIDTIFREIITDHPLLSVLEVYNLAAMSHVGISYSMPVYSTQVSAIGTLNLLETIKNSTYKDNIRFYQASTSEMYGEVPNNQGPLNENSGFNPNSPYAIAKLYGYYITNSYRSAYNIFACNGILFNHESPRRGHNFVTKKITNGVVDIIQGRSDKIYLGNMNSLRDWGHAQDYVLGMWLMLQQETSENYVLATGKQYSIREFVEKVFKYFDITIGWKGEGLKEIGYDLHTGKEYINISQKYFRPNEVGNLLGDPTKAFKKLGWKPIYSLDDLIKDMISDQLDKTSSK